MLLPRYAERGDVRTARPQAFHQRSNAVFRLLGDRIGVPLKMLCFHGRLSRRSGEAMLADNRGLAVADRQGGNFRGAQVEADEYRHNSERKPGSLAGMRGRVLSECG